MASHNTLKTEAAQVIHGENNNPSPEERAIFVMQRLEQFIREGRTISEGMNLRKWQEMARAEIANAIAEAQVDNQEDDVVTKRLLLTFGCSLTTIGFWGGLWAYGEISYIVAAFLCGAAGLILMGVALEWRVRKFWKRHQVAKRKKALRRCEDLTRRIKRMERELDKELKARKKELKDIRKTPMPRADDKPPMPSLAALLPAFAERKAKAG